MKKSARIVLLVLALVVALCLCACEPAAPAPEETQPTVDNSKLTVNSVLYYNLDRARYEGMADDSLTSRPKDINDGYFHVATASNGAKAEVLVKTRMLTNTIDSNTVMALTIGEDGLVSEVITLDTLGGSIVADGLFVTSFSATELVLNSNNSGSGESKTLALAEGAKIYDISDAEATGYCAATTLENLDEVYAIADADGKVTHVWVLHRAGQNTGRGMCICGAGVGGTHLTGCDGTIIYGWQPWTGATTLPTASGYWYLDVEGKTITLEGMTQYTENTEIYIDLNGHTILGPTGPEQSVFRCTDGGLTFKFTMLDSTGEAVVKLQTQEGNKSFQARLCVYRNTKHEVTFYGGTYDASEVVATKGQGGMIRVIENATLNIHGGTFIGTQVEGSCSNHGNILWCGGTFNMTGGTLKGGQANIAGGNIYMGTYKVGEETKYGTMNLTGGEIIDGKVNEKGGNIWYHETGTFNLNGTTVSGGTAGVAGPDIHMEPAAG